MYVNITGLRLCGSFSPLKHHYTPRRIINKQTEFWVFFPCSTLFPLSDDDNIPNYTHIFSNIYLCKFYIFVV